MATSQTYLLNPTSTSTSAYSAPSKDSGNGGESISDLLSSGGSPPLIVAFLAIGLFIIAMLAVFAWRRLSQSRRVRHQPISTDRPPKTISLGRRPIFWDIWAVPHVREEPPLGTMRWETMTPMAALLTFLILPVGPLPAGRPPIGSLDLGGCVLFRALKCLVYAVKRLYLPDPPPPPLSPAPPPAGPYEKDALPPGSHPSDDTSSLQVTVIIAMPTQQRCRSGTSAEDSDPGGLELGDICIGTMDVPWSERGGPGRN